MGGANVLSAETVFLELGERVIRRTAASNHHVGCQPALDIQLLCLTLSSS